MRKLKFKSSNEFFNSIENWEITFGDYKIELNSVGILPVNNNKVNYCLLAILFKNGEEVDSEEFEENYIGYKEARKWIRGKYKSIKE